MSTTSRLPHAPATAHGYTSYQTSVRRQRVFEPAQIRALPKGCALLLATGVKVAMLDLLPWYRGPLADQLRADVAAAEAQMTEAASTAAAGTHRGG